MEPDISVITSSRIFENLPRQVIEEYILPRGKFLSFRRGESIFHPLDTVSSLGILLFGKVKLVYYMEDGRQDIKNILLPGNALGMDLICTRTRLSPYQAVAASDCELFSFQADDILKPGALPEEYRLVCLGNLLLIISHVNMQNEYRLAILTRNSLRDRISVYLNMQAARNRSDTFEIPFSREEMASFLRVNRSALSHELSLMRRDGIIDFSKNRFRIIKQSGGDFDISMF